jgi:DNA-binding response OmpR family regulator
MKKVLLVEDDQFIRNIYIQMLSSHFSVDYCGDGLTGYKKATENNYDLILLDMYLPKMDGRKLYEQLEKNYPSKYKSKIIFLTNDDSEPTISFFKENKIEYIIKSSLNPDEFVKKIVSFLKPDNS